MNNNVENAIPFQPADILIPKKDFTEWSVIACDQYTSRPQYWEEVERIRNDKPSSLDLIFPEVYLNDGNGSQRIKNINDSMKRYLADGVFEEYKNALIYVERVQADGRIRHGIVGAIDLEAYSFTPNSNADIRATEKTVLERIPPRVNIRRGACLELPHAMLLIDDPLRTVIEPLAQEKSQMKKLYDFKLMMNGGWLRGYLIPKSFYPSIISAIASLRRENGMLFAVGDGNHSLASAKVFHDEAPNPLNRYALVELVNLHCNALDFEPIYRIVENVDTDKFTAEFIEFLTESGATLTDNGECEQEYTLVTDCGEKRIAVNDPPAALAVGTVQAFIDSVQPSYPDMKTDYIHGEDELKRLAHRSDCIGFLYGGLTKETLFNSVESSGVLPRKTFSMGNANDKRYYMEARLINQALITE